VTFHMTPEKPGKAETLLPKGRKGAVVSVFDLQPAAFKILDSTGLSKLLSRQQRIIGFSAEVQ